MSVISTVDIKYYNCYPNIQDLLDEIISGLSKKQKTLPHKLFYDERGSKIFEAICKQPEYYLGWLESQIFHDNAHEIAAVLPKECALIEPGAGNWYKVHLLLEAIKPACYIPIDISGEYLESIAHNTNEKYPWLSLYAICADVTQPFHFPPDVPKDNRVAFFPGSTIGNFEPAEMVVVLRRFSDIVGSRGGLLIGVDLQKDAATLEKAYNDSGGVCAAFNMNILQRINEEFSGNFSLSEFVHRAHFNAENNRIEMHLESLSDQNVKIRNQSFPLKKGETIRTENSYKYALDQFITLAETAGFMLKNVWTDPKKWYSVHYYECV